MALTKTIEYDKIEVVGPFKCLQVRKATVIKEDGVEITRSFHRKVLECVTSSYDSDTEEWTHTDTDVSDESTDIQDIAAIVWTDEVKDAKKTANESKL